MTAGQICGPDAQTALLSLPLNPGARWSIDDAPWSHASILLATGGPFVCRPESVVVSCATLKFACNCHRTFFRAALERHIVCSRWQYRVFHGCGAAMVLFYKLQP